MFRERHRQRRRPGTPPKETILSNVLGEFLDPIDALFTIFFSILFALLFTLSYGILIYYESVEDRFAALICLLGYGSGGYVAGRLAPLMLPRLSGGAGSNRFTDLGGARPGVMSGSARVPNQRLVQTAKNR